MKKLGYGSEIMLEIVICVVLGILLLSQFGGFFKRVLIGIFTMFLLNFVFNPLGIGVGINFVTLLISGMLGFYGVVALYAVQAIL